jgi:ABC-type amino acid transport substrate-binding protein
LPISQDGHPNATVTIPEGYEPEPELRWNVRLWRADDALTEAMNAAIDQIIDKRTAYQIYAKYGLAYHLPFPASDGAER